MPSIGADFLQQSFIAKRQSDLQQRRLLRSIKRLNKEVHGKAIQTYNRLTDSLDTTSRPVLFISSMENLERLSYFMSTFDALANEYRVAFKRTYDSHRADLFEGMKDKEERLMKVIERIGIKDDRITASQSTLKVMNAINEMMYKNINDMLVKWRSYVYDIYFQAITAQESKSTLREKFTTPHGYLKVGSSLEEISESEAAIAAVREKTAYVQAKAKENNYTYCWNVNPMDQRTKDVCISATLAGVIPEKEMGTNYGFPPRYVCRCELAYVRKDWTELNQSINNEIKTVRERLIDELLNAPKQMSFWYVGTTKVVPKDPIRAAGDKMYADIEAKLALVEGTEVPEFTL